VAAGAAVGAGSAASALAVVSTLFAGIRQILFQVRRRRSDGRGRFAHAELSKIRAMPGRDCPPSKPADFPPLDAEPRREPGQIFPSSTLAAAEIAEPSRQNLPTGAQKKAGRSAKDRPAATIRL
jgi:hypothetical protein